MLTTTWNNIETALPTLVATQGGYTTAQRGIVTLPNGQELFVKIGHDDLTKQWAHKEILVYRFLQKAGYSYAPKLIAVNDDETAFALEPLQNNWDWSDSWTKERLNATLKAMDDLAAILPENKDMSLFEKSFISETADGWRPLSKNKDLQQILCDKLIDVGRHDLAGELNFSANAQISAKFILKRTALVHNDIRADNCAWNKNKQEVKLIDWNWTQLGDQRIDVGSFLVHVHKTGFDISTQKHRLDETALHWLAGFWFNAAVQNPLGKSSEQASLRDYQLASGIVAFDLARNL